MRRWTRQSDIDDRIRDGQTTLEQTSWSSLRQLDPSVDSVDVKKMEKPFLSLA